MWSGEFSKQSFVSVNEWLYEIWCLDGDGWTSNGLIILTMKGYVEKNAGTMAQGRVKFLQNVAFIFIFIFAQTPSFSTQNHLCP